MVASFDDDDVSAQVERGPVELVPRRWGVGNRRALVAGDRDVGARRDRVDQSVAGQGTRQADRCVRRADGDLEEVDIPRGRVGAPI
jgi:hypothetical protein